ncbi:hypothetical protein ACFFRR_009495 [Megaselia abdita]
MDNYHRMHDDESVIAVGDRTSSNGCKYNQIGFATPVVDKSLLVAKRKMTIAVFLCVIFMITQFIGGWIAGSLAIMTDAAHLMSDCISFVIGLLSICVSGRPSDRRMSFGYKRVEVVGALASVLGIWVLTALLVYVAIERIVVGDYNINAKTMMVISGLGILINIAMAFVLHGPELFSHVHAHSHSHGHSHEGLPSREMRPVSTSSMESGTTREQSSHQEEHNINIRAAIIHVFGDFIQSVGVFLASIVIYCFPSAKLADPLCTVIFSVIVFFTTIRIFKESMDIILDAVPKSVPLETLQSDLEHIEGVKSIHHLNVWGLTLNNNVMMVHIVADSFTDTDIILQKATLLAQDDYNIKHCTIQIERTPLSSG